jgi:iron complex outermembrane receptor protein
MASGAGPTLNDPRNRPAYDESATSFSAAIIWEFVPETTLALSFANAERLPQAQELYARGIHLATNTYECGLMPHPLTCGGLDNNAALAKEVSNNVELSLRKHSGALTYSVNAFRNEVDDYIYARTLDQYEDFRLIKYTQQDAEFTGVEGEVTWQFDETLAATLFGDYVRAEFVEGGNLPRIPASRVGGRLNMDADGMGLELEYYHVNAQDDIAAYETRTPSYNMLNATVSIDVLGNDRYQVFVRGNNLLNEKVWNHTSFLAAVVPKPGRNLIAGFKYTF